MHRYNYANANPITGSDPTGYETYSELLTSISIQGTFVRSLTFGIINTGRIVVAKLLTSQQVDTLDVLETFAKSQLGYFFIETTFWETLPMINYGSGMFSGTKLGDKVNRVSGDLLNKYYSTPLSTVEEITSQNNKKTAIGMSEGGSESVYIPRDSEGNPIPLKKQRINGQDIPLPDPAAEGRPHTVLGGKVSSETGEVYRQSATFPGGTWPSANGYDVPWSEVHWTDHGTSQFHTNPHEHIFEYNPDKGGWIRKGPSDF